MDQLIIYNVIQIKKVVKKVTPSVLELPILVVFVFLQPQVAVPGELLVGQRKSLNG